MKKFLLFLSGVTLSMNMFGQTIATENFNSLTVGNLGTDLTGNTAGQGGYYLYGGTAAADYQVASIDAAHGNSLRLTSGAGYSSTANTFNRFVSKGITVSAAPGNDILKGSLDFYTGPATGAGRIQCVLYDDTAGVVGIGYDYATKKIIGLGRLTAVASGVAQFYSITLSGTVTYPANTWVTVSFTYNSTTGAYTWVTPEGSYSFSNAGYTLNPGLEPVEYDFLSVTTTGNTVANTAAVDNVSLLFGNAATLATHDVSIVNKEEVSVYPNPATDILNIKSASKINTVEIYDIAGRKINTELNNNSVNVKSLNPGNYIINVETKDGKTSKKFIKK